MEYVNKIYVSDYSSQDITVCIVNYDGIGQDPWELHMAGAFEPRNSISIRWIKFARLISVTINDSF